MNILFIFFSSSLFYFILFFFLLIHFVAICSCFVCLSVFQNRAHIHINVIPMPTPKTITQFDIVWLLYSFQFWSINSNSVILCKFCVSINQLQLVQWFLLCIKYRPYPVLVSGYKVWIHVHFLDLSVFSWFFALKVLEKSKYLSFFILFFYSAKLLAKYFVQLLVCFVPSAQTEG